MGVIAPSLPAWGGGGNNRSSGCQLLEIDNQHGYSSGGGTIGVRGASYWRSIISMVIHLGGGGGGGGGDLGWEFMHG